MQSEAYKWCCQQSMTAEKTHIFGVEYKKQTISTICIFFDNYTTLKNVDFSVDFVRSAC